ncbi:MAG TPA: ADP-ribosylglycohydrolase family protein [Dokdonella sp.]|uniref:ADP-ribosylglycohydrolase family protein n=1 Tax=Dokdonella sp. TaxID=2291710 RepID=UPI0025BB3378|nr:ADP-ribosylglycohydrolase family protein [Dokdonella sp.]MBX3692061.1 ADP-ribosylglycohydrolase family protein [Dokdonella sp.]MCW5568761.1 ADP-ribosylglycohydrolase family protein [Dokdonella sp.]HNR92811.1 ADP-ribosylglycohydrolase family protein [Dokdonella sp.]
MSIDLAQRYRGCLLGLACGDAVGTTLEFMPRGSFAEVTGMHGGGPFKLQPGQWTDDTSMALCLADSLLACGGFDALDQMRRYHAWWRQGLRSSTGVCFDIGRTVGAALARFERDGEPYAGSTDPTSAGNGSLMRLAPIVLRWHPDTGAIDRYAADSSRTTHAAAEAVEACRLFACMLTRALDGHARADVLDVGKLVLAEPKLRAIAEGNWLGKPREAIRGSGYAVESLEAALWCFAHTTSFESAVLAAANLGDDADTTGAITGQIAGAYYGVGGIPADWLAVLHAREEIDALAVGLFAAATDRA